MTDSTYTATEQQKKRVPGRPFAKGDTRINRKGRPKAIDELRQLAQSIAHEALTMPDGTKRTVIEALLRKWAGSPDARLQMAFIKYAYGEPEQDIRIGGVDTDEIPIRVVDYRYGLAAVTPGSDEDSE